MIQEWIGSRRFSLFQLDIAFTYFNPNNLLQHNEWRTPEGRFENPTILTEIWRFVEMLKQWLFSIFLAAAPSLSTTTAISLSRAPNLPVYPVCCWSSIIFCVSRDMKGFGKQWHRTLRLPQETSTEGKLGKSPLPHFRENCKELSCLSLSWVKRGKSFLKIFNHKPALP